MLTSDLVEVKRREDQLAVVRLSPKRRTLLVELITTFYAIAQTHIGETRAELARKVAAVDAPGREAKLRKAAWKLVEDACSFEESESRESEALRKRVFERATELRKRMIPGEHLDREKTLEGLSEELGKDPEAIDAQLFSDLREAQRLLEVATIEPRSLGETFELLEAEAVLLRAINVTLDLTGGPEAFRQFHRELRFRGLLFQVEKTEDGYRFIIDGPFSLFESVTKYGLELALALRAARKAGSFKLMALVRWSSNKTAGKSTYVFRTQSAGELVRERREHPYVTDLKKEIAAIGEDWSAKKSDRLFTMKDVGIVAPDLVLEHRSGKRVFVELMGFWSRAAVWSRIEQAKHLEEPFIFVVSKKLRVSEDALAEDGAASLYVYATTPRAKKLLERADALLRQSS